MFENRMNSSQTQQKNRLTHNIHLPKFPVLLPPNADIATERERETDRQTHRKCQRERDRDLLENEATVEKKGFRSML